MKQIICLFEDEGYKNLLPLTYTRPVYDLRCGILTLGQKIIKYYPQSTKIYHTRRYLAQSIKEKNENNLVNNFDFDNILFINGRLLFNYKLSKIISKMSINSILINAGIIIAASLDRNNLQIFVNALDDGIDLNKFDNVIINETNATFINYPWDLINKNIEEITSDFEFIRGSRKKVINNYKAVEINGKKNVIIEKGVRIAPFTLLDASEGPIYIAKNAIIMSHVSIQGPAYIGESSVIKMHASLYHGTNIGCYCKVGGEIENSIIHSYTNKQHEGFIGHSYLGSWVNIGASTNNSDLKNNYGIVDVPINNTFISSGSQFAGLFMGDHSKTAINTMFNTGSVVGVCCNIFGNGFPPKYIPSFSWGGSEKISEYQFDKAVDVIESVMARRKMVPTENDILVLKTIFAITKSERTY